MSVCHADDVFFSIMAKLRLAVIRFYSFPDVIISTATHRGRTAAISPILTYWFNSYWFTEKCTIQKCIIVCMCTVRIVQSIWLQTGVHALFLTSKNEQHLRGKSKDSLKLKSHYETDLLSFTLPNIPTHNMIQLSVCTDGESACDLFGFYCLWVNLEGNVRH